MLHIVPIGEAFHLFLHANEAMAGINFVVSNLFRRATTVDCDTVVNVWILSFLDGSFSQTIVIFTRKFGNRYALVQVKYP